MRKPRAGFKLGWCLQVGQFGGLSDELESLKRDKNVLMLELVRLRQQQQVQQQKMSRNNPHLTVANVAAHQDAVLKDMEPVGCD